MTIPVDTLVAAWGFNKDLGEVAGQYKDYIGGLILASNDSADHPAAAAKVGAGAYAAKNVAGTRLTVTNPPISLSAGGTISLWVRVANLDVVTDYIWEFVDGDGELIRLMHTYSVALGQRYRFQQQTNTPLTIATNAPADTDWHLLTMCASAPYEVDPENAPGEFAQSIKIYVDGVFGIETFLISGSGCTLLRLCGGESAFNLNGDIDALHIWQSALTPEQVAEVYNAGTGWEYTPAPPADNTPDTFDFTDVTDADLSTVYASDSQTIQNCDAGTPITVESGLEYRLDGGAWTAAAGVTNGVPQTIELRLTSSDQPETTVTKSVTVGTLAVDWSVTTGAVMSIVSNIIGSSPLTSRIFRSRIVQGMI